MKRFLLTAAICGMGLVAAVPALAQSSRCADCHYANPKAPRPEHLQAWDRSPHGRQNVGCEKCHGGNATSFEPMIAHRGILNAGNRASSVNRRNLPATCGSCHVGPFAAFRSSRHYQLLQAANDKGPTCSTCHGEVDGRLLSAKALASQCNQCHGPGEVAPRAERARLVRDQYESLSVVREELKLAQTLVKRVDDKTRRTELTQAIARVEAPLTRAVEAGHKFVYDDMKEYLALAHDQVEELLGRLANR